MWMLHPTIDLDSLQAKMPLLILPVLRKFYRQNKQSIFFYSD